MTDMYAPAIQGRDEPIAPGHEAPPPAGPLSGGSSTQAHSDPLPQGTTAEVAVGDIRPAPGCLRDVPVDGGHVARLAEVFDACPPVTVQVDTLRLIDGRHRLEAAILLGRSQLVARLVEAPDDQLFAARVRANAVHGLPLTREERRRAVTDLLHSPLPLLDPPHGCSARWRLSHPPVWPIAVPEGAPAAVTQLHCDGGSSAFAAGTLIGPVRRCAPVHTDVRSAGGMSAKRSDCHRLQMRAPHGRAPRATSLRRR